MWCYHKPGFEALLLAELQKQQQCSQFCDTLLMADGVSVPVHSCVLSAVSPQVSFALSSMPVPPAGQRRLLEFRSFGAGALLRLVRLLYSGEMAGECDEEKQEVISAAAVLGIRGLVEVADRDPKSSDEARGGQHTEVGVQTEPHIPEESGAGQGIWRREVRDGGILLWKEVLADSQKDTGTQATQTEEPDMNTALPVHPTASLSTIDASTLHSLGQTDSHFVHSHIPYAPVSLVYRADDNETADPPSHPAASVESAGLTSMAPSYSSVPPSVNLLPNQMTLCAADPQSRWTGPPGADGDVTAGEDWEGERLEQFQDNIPGFISYFLNPDKEEGSRCRRAGRRRGPRVRGGRSSGASEARAEGRAKGRRGGRLTETVDVQDVGVSRLQKLFLQKGGRGPPRPGQGGGAVGRKLCVKTRELLRRAKRGQQYSTEWDVSQSEKMLTFTERGRGGGGGGRGVSRQGGGRNTEQQLKQNIPPAGRTLRPRAKPAASSLSFSSASSSSRRPSSSPVLPSHVAAGSSPAASPLHPPSLSPPASPSQEGQPEHIDRLLEEVMMGLDILPNSNAAPRAEPADHDGLRSLRSACASARNNLTQNKQNPSTEMESRPGVQGPCEVPLVQQQDEGELTDILDHFLQSFEHHICDCSSGNAGQPYCAQPNSSARRKTRRLQPARSSQATTLQQGVRDDTPSRRLQRGEAAAPPKRRGRPPRKSRSPGRQPERKERGTRKNVSSSEKRETTAESLKPRMYHEQDKQLQQRPVVRLERGEALLVKAELQGSCQSPGEESPTNPETDRKFYPIRNRLQKADVEGPSLHKPGDPGWKFSSNGLLSTLSNSEGPTPQIQPVDERPENRHEGQGDAWAVQPEGAPSRGQKRRAESEGASDGGSVVKRVCVGQTAPSSTEAPANGASEAADVEDVIDVETVPASGDGDGSQRGGGGGRGGRDEPWSRTPLGETKGGSAEDAMERDSDEVISVDGDAGGVTDLEESRTDRAGRGCCQSRAPAGERASLGSTGGSEDEDIDVTGGSSPLASAVDISWTESPGHKGGDEGDEDVDVG